jgi:hypothetical protein
MTEKPRPRSPWRDDTAFCTIAQQAWPADWALAQRGGYDRNAAQKLLYRYQGYLAAKAEVLAGFFGLDPGPVVARPDRDAILQAVADGAQTVQQIGAKLGCSEQQARTGADELVDIGLLDMRKTRTGTGGKFNPKPVRNVYSLTDTGRAALQEQKK